ncbi:MAG: hybrid sensor histidine kinase/response regulator [Gammaproteobacteria bacterium]
MIVRQHLPPIDVVHCLVVDDVEENLIALTALLRAQNVEIHTARSGAEALDLLLRHDMALAFLDVQMPEMDGFQLAELMRGSERTRHVPIIFVTAGIRDQLRMFRGYESGAVDFLYKPIDPHMLRGKADTFFQLHRQKQQLARELHERTETLRLNEMFIAVLGHDLRNPLHAMMLSAHGIHRVSTEEPVKQAATRIVSSGNRMSRMIEDLLDLARGRLAGGIQIVREPVDLASVVGRVVRESQAGKPGRALEIHQQGHFNGQWDAGRLAQVASNLIANALQYGDPKEPVIVELDGTGETSVEMIVSNAGGIPRELLPQIFDPFRGRSEPSRRSEGLGLGLYIVKELVEAHEGRVGVSSNPGERTRFTVRLPRRPSPD